jgi:hypothetical protein
MGFFGELAACKAQALAVPFWLLATAFRWIVWVMVAAMVPGLVRVLWFLLVGLIEWLAWLRTLSCLRDRLVPYQLSIVLGIAPVLAARTIISPYLLDPVRGYMSLNYPYSPPNKLVEGIVRFGFLLWIWRIGFGALLRARSQRACRTVSPEWKKTAWNLTGAVFVSYLFITYAPFLYMILHLMGSLTEQIPFCKDLLLGLFMGLASFFWFTMYADGLVLDTCRS